MSTRHETKQIPPILAALIIALAPHALDLPAWISIFCLACWAYAFYLDRNSLKWPGKTMRGIVMFIGVAGIAVTYSAVFDAEAFLGLLALSAGLKSLELENFRHRMIALFLAYFLVLARVLNADSLISAIFMASSVIWTTAVMIHLNRKGSRLTHDLRLAVKIFLQALPAAIALFFLFPRIHGNIWGISRSSAGVSGFSDQISPGDVSALAQNPDVAFRVQFTNTTAQPSILYWRGLVLWRFDGKTWRQGIGIPVGFFPIYDQNPIQYALTLEPHENRWLFALDIPTSVPNAANMRADHTLYLKRISNKRQIFELTSVPRHESKTKLRPWEKQALRIPASGNPKARNLARSWAEQSASENQIIKKALDFIRKGGFAYTLFAPSLSGDMVDDFLFNTKAGFCEHYASAFAFLMRAAGVPARVVVGYLGGQKNPFGEYLIVRQSDAHAWTEVWTADQGWRRVDPTAEVAPERIGQETGADLANQALRRGMQYPAIIAKFLDPIALVWDAAANQWNLWVIGYTQQRQFNLIERIGLPKTGIHLIMILLIACGIILFWIAATMRFRGFAIRQQTDPVQRSYEKFCKKLARSGLPRRPDQGPLDYARHIGSIRKDLKKSVDNIIRLYIRLRYASEFSRKDIQTFHQSVKKFTPWKQVE